MAEVVVKSEELAEEPRTETKLLELMTTEVPKRLALYKTLEFCRTPRSPDEADARMSWFPEISNSVYRPSTIRQWLEEAGGLERRTIEGEKVVWQTTPAGEQALQSLSLPKQLKRLIEEHSQDRDVYLKILQFCATPRDKSEIETTIGEHPSQAEPKMFVTSFLSALEDAGALEWSEKWKTTALGVEVLEARKLLDECNARQQGEK